MDHILIAEDSETQALQLRKLLEGAGFSVQVTGSGTEALAALAARPPSALVTDLEMPGMNGLDLVMAAHRDFPQVPVILMTAFGNEELAVQALQSGAASYVPKKIVAEHLVSTLVDVLEVAHHGREDARVTEFLGELTFRLELPVSAPPVTVAVAEVLRGMAELRCGDELDRLRIGVALEAAIYHLHYFGNLELTPDQLHGSYGLDEASRAFQDLLKQRCEESPFSARKLHLAARLTRDEFFCTLTQEGARLRLDADGKAVDSIEIEGEGNRGWLLVRAVMSEVRLDDNGKQLTLRRRFQR